jgi:hypothetical protein
MIEQIVINLIDGKIKEAYLKTDVSTFIPIDMNSLIDLILKANESEKITVIKENNKITKWRK